MRHVDRVDSHPFACAVLPQVGREHERGYIRTFNIIPSGAHDPEVFVSVVAIEQLAHEIGHPTRDEFEARGRLLEEQQERIEQLEAENKSLREFEQAAVYSLEHVGQKVRKKPGPRPKEEVAV